MLKRVAGLRSLGKASLLVLRSLSAIVTPVLRAIAGRATGLFVAMIGWLWRTRFCLALVPPGAPRLNCAVAGLCVLTTGTLLINYEATPSGAGSNVSARLSQLGPLPAVAEAAPAPGGAPMDLGAATAQLEKQIHAAVGKSRVALELHVALLQLSKFKLEQMPDYTATFVRQERLDGQDVLDPETMELKLRHQPFGLYMKWIEGKDNGQEVLYVDGQMDGRMLVKLGGAKGKILPAVPVEPTSSLAMSKSRHPVTEIGLLHLTKTLLKFRTRDLGLTSGVKWEMLDNQKFGDRNCYCFVCEYSDRSIEPVYRKSITYIDKEHSLPICVKGYTWPEPDQVIDAGKMDDATFIEFFGYTNLKMHAKLPLEDFDRTNTAYRFVRKRS